MRVIFELSKEYHSLPADEVISSIKGEKINYNLLEKNEDVVVVDAKEDKLDRLAGRIALSFFLDKFLFSCKADPKEIRKICSGIKISIDKNKSFRVRCNNRAKNKRVNSLEVEREVGGIFATNYRVNLRKPDFEIRVVVTDEKAYVGFKLFEIDRKSFEKRKAQHRPFFSPISLHPKLARALVNISEISENEVFLDPFCGTGGILIEAALIDAKIIGSDISKKMVNGCKRNLEYYGIKEYKLYQCDIGEIPKFVDEVDAVATDFPYGRSTSTCGERITTLYERGAKAIYEVLKKGRKAVVGLPNEDALHILDGYLKREKVYVCRVHKSLTRYFGVYKKT